jgi:hypothetical protein
MGSLDDAVSDALVVDSFSYPELERSHQEMGDETPSKRGAQLHE